MTIGNDHCDNCNCLCFSMNLEYCEEADQWLCPSCYAEWEELQEEE